MQFYVLLDFCFHFWSLISTHFSPENKNHFKRFMDSVLSKATKLKTLHKDLKQNYAEESVSEPKPYLSYIVQISHG